MSRSKRAEPRTGGRRARLMEELMAAVRAQSTSAVLLHGAVADRLGLSATDQRTVELLGRIGPLTAGQLGEQTGLASASVTALIDRLEQKGFVQRVRDPGDRRRVFVQVSPDGASRMAEAFAGLAAHIEELWAPYTIQQLETIRDFLARSAAFSREAIARLASLPRR